MSWSPSSGSYNLVKALLVTFFEPLVVVKSLNTTKRPLFIACEDIAKPKIKVETKVDAAIESFSGEVWITSELDNPGKKQFFIVLFLLTTFNYSDCL